MPATRHALVLPGHHPQHTLDAVSLPAACPRCARRRGTGASRPGRAHPRRKHHDAHRHGSTWSSGTNCADCATASSTATTCVAAARTRKLLCVGVDLPIEAGACRAPGARRATALHPLPRSAAGGCLSMPSTPCSKTRRARTTASEVGEVVEDRDRARDVVKGGGADRAGVAGCKLPGRARRMPCGCRPRLHYRRGSKHQRSRWSPVS